MKGGTRKSHLRTYSVFTAFLQAQYISAEQVWKVQNAGESERARVLRHFANVYDGAYLTSSPNIVRTLPSSSVHRRCLRGGGRTWWMRRWNSVLQAFRRTESQRRINHVRPPPRKLRRWREEEDNVLTMFLRRGKHHHRHLQSIM